MATRDFPNASSDPVVREALRLSDRYLSEVVEAFGLCPWAKQSRLGGHVARTVIVDRARQEELALRALTEWSEQPEVEIGLLIFPGSATSQTQFQRFCNQLIESDTRRRERSSAPFALAAFHPDAELDLTSADRLVPFLRKTPDPTIQAVRISALERVRGQEASGTRYVDIRTLRLDELPKPEPTLREKISAHNLSTTMRERDALLAAIESILNDRAPSREAGGDGGAAT